MADIEEEAENMAKHIEQRTAQKVHSLVCHLSSFNMLALKYFMSNCIDI